MCNFWRFFICIIIRSFCKKNFFREKSRSTEELNIVPIIHFRECYQIKYSVVPNFREFANESRIHRICFAKVFYFKVFCTRCFRSWLLLERRPFTRFCRLTICSFNLKFLMTRHLLGGKLIFLCRWPGSSTTAGASKGKVLSLLKCLNYFTKDENASSIIRVHILWMNRSLCTVLLLFYS